MGEDADTEIIVATVFAFISLRVYLKYRTEQLKVVLAS
jgi:hypothetical protein